MRRLALLVLVLAGCTADLPRNSPLDPESPLAADGEVTGQVALDPEGRAFGEVPLDEVEIAVEGQPAVRAGADGRYRLAGLRPGTYELRVSARYHEPAVIPAVQVAPRDPTEVDRITLRRGRGAVSGRVHLHGLPEGGDHSGTTVTVRDQPPEEPRFTVTNAAGDFHIADVVSGRHGLGLTRSYYPGGSREDVEVPVGGTVHLGTFTLGQNAGTVTGTLRLEDRDPPHEDYASVTVALVGTGASTTAAEDGTFEVTTTLGGLFAVRASRADYEPAAVQAVAVMPGEQVTLDETLVLRRSRGTIVGRVAIPGEADLSGVEVIVVGTAHRVTTGPDGAFRLAEVPTRPATVQLVAQKITPSAAYATAQPVTVELSAGAATDAGTLVLSRTGGDFALTGRIHDPVTGTDRQNDRVTASRWVTLELSSLNPGAFDRIRRASDRSALEALELVPFSPGDFVDCSDESGGRESAPTCFELPEGDGEQDVWIELASSVSGAQVGPFRGAIVLDTTPPGRPPGTPAVEVNEGAAWVGAGDDATARVALSAVDATSGVAFMRLWLAEAETVGSGADTQLVCPTGAAVVIPDVPAEPYAVGALRALPSADGRACFHALFYDAAGIPSPVFTAGLGLDRHPPVLETLGLSGVQGEPAGQTRSTTLAVQAAATGAAYERLTLLLSEDENLAGAVRIERAAAADGALLTETFFALRPGDGPKRVYAGLEDPAGNRAAGRLAEITLDALAPAAPLLRLVEDDSRPFNGSTNSRLVSLELLLPADAREAVVTGCGLLAGDPADLENVTDPFVLDWTAAPPPVVAVDCVLPGPTTSAPEQRLVQVRTRDAAGNESPPGVAAVVLDQTAPPIPAFSILPSPGSDTGNAAEVFAASRIVTFQAGLTGDAPDQMEVFEGAAPAGAWVPFSAAGQHVLSGEADGVYTVRLRVRDPADNVSGIAEAEVRLEQTPPPVPAYVSPPPAFINTPRADPASDVTVPFTVSLAASPEPALFWRYEVHVQGAGMPGYATCSDTAPGACVVDVPSNRQDTLIRVRAVDRAGNVSPENLHFITHDDVAPGPPVILAPANDTLTGQPLVAVEIGRLSDDPSQGDASGIDRFEGHVQSGADSPCAGGLWNTLAGETRFVYDLPHETNTVCLRAVDRAGNESGPAAVTVVVDAAAPVSPSLAAFPVVNGESVLLWLQEPLPGPAETLQTSDGVPFDPGGHFSHFEILGGPFAQWTALPATYDGASQTFRPCATGCAYDGRHFFEVPVLRDRTSVFHVRGVDLAGNAGDPSTAIEVTEQSTFFLTEPPASGDQAGLLRPRIHGDNVLWRVPGAGAEPGLHLRRLGETAGLSTLFLPVTTGSEHDLFSDRVVWEAQDPTAWDHDVFTCDLARGALRTFECAGVPRAVAATPAEEGAPAIHGDQVLYSEGLSSLEVVAVPRDPLAPLTSVFTPATTSSPLGGDLFTDPLTAETLVAWLEPQTHSLRLERNDGTVAQAVTVDATVSQPSLSGGTAAWTELEPSAGASRLRLWDVDGSPWWAHRFPGRPDGIPEIWRSGARAVVAARTTTAAGTVLGLAEVRPATEEVLATHTTQYGGAIGGVALSGWRAAFVHGDVDGERVGVLDWSWTLPVHLASGITSPSVSGGRVAWLQDGHVFLVDRDAGSFRQVTTTAAFARRSLAYEHPYLVWREVALEGEEPRIVAQHVETGARATLWDCGGVAGATCGYTRCAPAASSLEGGRLAYTYQSATGYGVCLADLRTLFAAGDPVSETVVASVSQAVGTTAALTGDRVLWRAGVQEIWQAQVGVGSPGCLVGPQSAGCLAVDASAKEARLSADWPFVVYLDTVAKRLRLYDAARNVFHDPFDPLAGEHPPQQQPRLRGGRLVYLANPGIGSAAHVRVLDLATLTDARVAVSPSVQSEPSGDAGSVVWIDGRFGGQTLMWRRER